MKLLYNEIKGLFFTVSKYEEREEIKAAGFRWDPSLKIWYTKDLDVAKRLSGYAPETVLDKMLELERRANESIALSKSARAEIDLPRPAGLEYLPFQKAGIAYAIQRKNTLIADSMGLGKTIEAIGVINALNLRRVLIICPATVKLNWKDELEKWLVKEHTISVATAQNGVDKTVDIIITNFDILKKFPWFRTVPWDLIVVDEAHKCKSAKTIRTKEVLAISKNAKRKVLLTGTPIVNRPAELFTLLNLLEVPFAVKWWDYAKRYCNAQQGYWGWDFSGASNLDELQRKLRETCMVRRLKEDVLKELPPKRRQIIEIASNGQFKAQLEREQVYLTRAKDLQKQLDDAEKDGYIEEVKKLRGLAKSRFEELAIIRHETALLKVPNVIEHCEELLETANKIVVFAHHKDVIAKIAKGLTAHGVVTLTGDDNERERAAAVKDFQTNNKVRVFVGSIQAAGLGITLTAASLAVFAELSHVPGDISQGEDRIHRIGQVDSVLVQHLVVNGSIDANLAKTIVKKQQVIDKALDK